MGEEKIMPEERLLRIIENPKSENVKPFLTTGKGVRGLDHEKNAQKLVQIKSWFKKLWANRKNWNFFTLRTFNKVIAGVCSLLSVFLLFDFIKGRINLTHSLKDIETGRYSISKQDKKKAALDVNLEEHLAKIEERNIFALIPLRDDVDVTAPVSQPFENLKLVGIIWSDNPQVMIEQSKEKKTSLLSSGGRIGKIRVKNIGKNSVVLEMDGQEFELR